MSSFESPFARDGQPRREGDARRDGQAADFFDAETSGTPLCEGFQADLSRLADGELPDEPAARCMAHLETCSGCRDFFDHVRAQVRMHRSVAGAQHVSAEGLPEGLVERCDQLTGRAPGLGAAFEARQWVHRLANIFYQLGKAYTLSVIDPRWRQRVFEPAVAVECERAAGRGFVDGVVERSGQNASRSGPGGFDWSQKRHLLNGTLERIVEPQEKARRLLEECLSVEEDHEHALIYLAMLDVHGGKVLSAERRLRTVFETAIDPGSRGHAAMQLGCMLVREEDFRAALPWFRWITVCRMADEDARFAVAYFNVGLCYAHLERPEPALSAFRAYLDRHPGLAGQLAQAFQESPGLRAAIDRQPGFSWRLLETCPELFAPVQTNTEEDGQ